MTTAYDPEHDPKPQPPRAPEQWECCQSGCEPCVYDRYWEAVDRYERALSEWESRNKSRGGADSA
jgi:hypothetical protein